MKENNIQNNKENNVNLKANNDCIRGSGSLQKVRAATPQVSHIPNQYVDILSQLPPQGDPDFMFIFDMFVCYMVSYCFYQPISTPGCS